MPLNDRSGRFTALSLPPEGLADWPALARARAEYDRLLAQHQASGQQLARLEEERQKAENEDKRRAAGILRKRPGDPHPGWPKRNEVDQAAAAERDRREALGGALLAAEADLRALGAEHQAAWAADVAEQLHGAREQLRQAVEAWAAARDRLREASALAAWVDRLPDLTAYRVRHLIHVDGLKAPHGGPPTAGEVLTALRAEAEAPVLVEPRPQRDQRNWPSQALPEAWGPGGGTGHVGSAA